jgi:biotin carboxyl carrier protein|uniref:Acetyl-CoA carboxylase biotin carboxyl carrier protein subunit n=1 Tax=Mesoaciditoga lauensis TaxID=1495039 RepID=A0A7V3RFA9_9BACT
MAYALSSEVLESEKGVISMLKKYLIKVNGKSYEVEVEEIEPAYKEQHLETKYATQQSSTHSTPPTQQQPAKITQIESEEKSQESINAPMSGTIVKIKVGVGQMVKDGQTLLTLEAMKMENEILAPHDCKIKEILVKENQQVEIDQTLVKIE